MREEDRPLSWAVDALTAAIEAAEGAGLAGRARRLRGIRERVLDEALGRTRRWWEVWRR